MYRPRGHKAGNVCMYVCTCVGLYTYIHTYTLILTHLHHTSIHTHTRTYIIYTYTPKYLHIYLHAYIHTYSHTRSHTYTHLFFNTHIIHPHIHTYITYIFNQACRAEDSLNSSSRRNLDRTAMEICICHPRSSLSNSDFTRSTHALCNRCTVSL